ncbi:MAG: DUF1501 domain-containing protein [Verrucomicrobia bacterium]|nr:DUF1501 domain-containing protein [Verrucomicrobiota bacterium]MBM3872004.1 DUF1501 domain-containing protein [Verrucomicrobiota bacterium]
MLTLEDRLHRRQFLRVGGLSLGGLTLADWFAFQAHARAHKLPLKDKSVIFLFQHGGPSQFETFDPKMDAPREIRSATGEIPTKIPGITFGSTMGRLARLNDKFSIVRSFHTGDANHDIKPIVGRDTLRANMGTLYARVAGALRPDTAMPTNVALFPRAVNMATGPAITQFGNFEATGEFGSAYAPFVPGAGGGLQADLKLNLPQARLNDRRELLASLDQWKRRVANGDAFNGLDTFQQQAFAALERGLSDAFDLTQEDPRLVTRYDTAPLLPKDKISPAWKNREHYADNAATLGKLLLLARRLCERGAGFVTVTTSFVWDMHSDINNAPMTVGMDYVGRPFDHAVSAFIEDCEARGLRDKILLVCCGEMGRTPRINAKGGRDHWGGLAPLLLYGGGLQMGKVIGAADRDGGTPADNPVTMQNLLATVMHTLLDLGEVRAMDGLPKSLVDTLTGSEPIKGLV